jgi:Flp pilus assembly pilin Flp
MSLPAYTRRNRPTGWKEGRHMMEITHRVIARMQSQEGQTMAEYAVVLGVITIAVVVTLGALSTAIQNTLTNVIGVL